MPKLDQYSIPIGGRFNIVDAFGAQAMPLVQDEWFICAAVLSSFAFISWEREFWEIQPVYPNSG